MFIRRVLLALTLALGAGLAVMPAAQAAYPGADGRIAFVRDGNVFTVNPDGSGLAQLTRTGLVANPVWSPDGRQIAYTRSGALLVMNADGSGKRRLAVAPAVDGPSWSPDGKYLAAAGGGRLLRIDPTGQTVVMVFREFNEYHEYAPVETVSGPVAWSADGASIAFEAAGFCTAIYDTCFASYSIARQRETLRWAHGGGGVDKGRTFDPDFSPDAAQLLFTDITYVDFPPATVTGIYRVVARTFQVQDFIPDATDAAYSPQGNRLALVRNNAGVDTVFLRDLTSGVETDLTTGSQPDWQPLPAG